MPLATPSSAVPAVGLVACLVVVGARSKDLGVPILTMLRAHGLVNALAFLGLGLLAWTALRPQRR